jgi:hypothetical protein
MRIIKEFAEFEEKGPKETNLWRVTVKSHAKLNGLTSDDVDKLLDINTYTEHLDFKEEHNKKMKEEYDKYPLAKWQLAKGVEIENLFFDNLDFKIEGDKAYVDTKFEVFFTEQFDERDVIGWAEGFNRITKAFLMQGMKNIVNKTHDENKNKIEYQFLKDLLSNEEFVVRKIK